SHPALVVPPVFSLPWLPGWAAAAGFGVSGRGGSDVTDERRPRPNTPRRDRPVSDEEFRAALERETDRSLHEDPERRRYYRAGDLPGSGSPSGGRGGAG